MGFKDNLLIDREHYDSDDQATPDPASATSYNKLNYSKLFSQLPKIKVMRENESIKIKA